MFTAAVHTLKRLLMQEADESVTGCDLLHHLHRELVVIGCDICRGIDGCKLMLRGSHFVVLRLGKDTELPELVVEILHELCNAGLDVISDNSLCGFALNPVVNLVTAALIISGGIGFGDENFFFDLTGSYHIYKTTKMLYNEQFYNIKNKYLYITMTFGVRF